MWSNFKGLERFARCSNISHAVLRASCERCAVTDFRTRSFFVKEYHSTSPRHSASRRTSTLARSPRPTGRSTRIVTLDPTKLNPQDWKDWSGRCVSRVSTKTADDGRPKSAWGFEYYPSRNHLTDARSILYPSHARGFLYYHPANSNVFAPEFNEFDVGHVRFRCVPSPETPFDAGEDLILPTGAPWHISGTRLMGIGRPLLDLALCEGLISEDEVTALSLIQHGGVYRNNGASRYIQRFDKPFVIYMAVRRNSIVFAPTSPSRDKNENEILLFRTGVFSGYEGSETVDLIEQCFTSGVIVCRFEAYSFDDHGEPNAFALRVDRVLEPVTQVASLPVNVPQPMAGELLKLAYMQQESGHPRNAPKYHLDVRPWTLKLDSPWPAIHRVGRRLHALYMAQYRGGPTGSHVTDSIPSSLK